MNTAETSIPGINRLHKVGFVVGIAALACMGYIYVHDPLQFMRSYLFAFVFWMGLPLGATALRLIHNLVSGTWGFPLRRPLESATKTLPWMAMLGLPLLMRLPLIFPWADPNVVAHDEILQYRAPYMNVHFFIARAAIYFAFCMLVTRLINRWSREQDENGNPALTMRIKRLSAPSLPIFAVLVSLAAVDWVMSLEAHWISTIFGFIFIVGQLLATMSLMTISAIRLSKQESMRGLVTPKLLNDYGNLLLVFTMLWAYLSFSQFLIIWGGNLRDEVPWYMSRAMSGWAWVALLLVVFHFAVPFFLLLMRFVKRRAERLSLLAAGLLLMTMVDTYWLIEPSFSPNGPRLEPADLIAMLAIGGIWFWRYAANLQSRSYLPMNDPRLKVLLQHHAEA